MTAAILLLLAKSAIILIVATVAAALTRRASAAMRHVIWTAALSACVLLPLAQILPTPSIAGPSWSIPVTVSAASTHARVNWLPVLYFAGAGIAFLRVAFAFVTAMRLGRGGTGIQYVSDLPGPVAWGIGTKQILIPTSHEWSDARLSAVLAHEQSHLRRHDCWTLLISEFACALYWCNPLVWYAASQLRREQEHAADDEVLQSGVSPIAYAEHLVGIAREGRRPLLLAGAVHRSDLTYRVEAILDPERNRTIMTKRMLLAGMALLLTLTLPLASMQATRKIYKVGQDGVIAPKLIEKQEPNYTQEATEAKIEGSVKLTGILDVDGRLHDVKVIVSLDDGLDANAVAAVEKWRFEPAKKDGSPVPVSVSIEVNFRLE